MLPLQAPGQSGPLRVPAVVVNFSLSKRAAVDYADKLREIANTLPDESDLTVAHSLDGIEQLAGADRKFRG